MSNRIKHSLLSKYYKIDTKLGVLHVHLDHDKDDKIQRVFSQIAPLGSDIASNTALIGILITEFLKANGDINKILKHLNSIKGSAIGTWEGQTIDSLPHAIGMAIQAFLEPASAEQILFAAKK